MYHQEHQIAQAEFNIFQAKFNRPPAEGMTVQVPNIIDRMAAALKGVLTGRTLRRKPQLPQRKDARAQGMPAK